MFKFHNFKTCKKNLSLLFIFLLGVNCFAIGGGVMSGEKNLQIIETKWFDVIFSETSAVSAEIIAKNADALYEEVCAEFDAVPVARMPVVVTPAVEVTNAYFSAAPYNFIVVYDYAPEISEGGSLAVFSENLLNIFRHEIVHAVTFNLKNKGWQVVGKIFGDIVNPAYLFVSSGFTEGTAVAIESENGEGRLNDSYAMHVVRQAKIEGVFPKWKDIQGASDIYPVGSYYQFNGAFCDWIRKKYGKEKFANLWYKCVNFGTIAFQMAFRSVYGFSVNEAWSNFQSDLNVPDVAAYPIDDGNVVDVFNFISGKETNSFSMKNKSASRYGSLTMSDKGLACVDFSDNSVLFFSKNQQGNFSAPKILFRHTGLVAAKFSRDGDLLAISYLSNSKGTSKNRVAVYDVKKNSFYELKETGLHDAAIISNGEKYFLACVKTVSQKSEFVIYELEGKTFGDNKKISAAKKINSYPFATDEIISGTVDCGDGKMAYILKSGNSWNIIVQDLAGEKNIYEMPSGMAIRGLSCSSSVDAKGNLRYVLYLSCATKETLPRLAKMYVSDATTLFMQTNDISGGVFSPVSDENGRIFYSGEFFKNSRLLMFDEKNINFTEVAFANSTTPLASGTAALANARTLANGFQLGNATPLANAHVLADATTKKYNPLKYYGDGIFLPLPLARTYTLTADGVESNQLWLGAFYASSNPWANNIAIFSAGFNPSPFEAAFSFNLTGGTDTKLFTYNTLLSVGFDKKGFLQTFDSLSLSSTIPFGRYFSFSASDTASVFYGRSLSRRNNAFEKIFRTKELSSEAWRLYYVDFNSNNLIVKNLFSPTISAIHKMGGSYYEYGGASLGLLYGIDYTKAVDYPNDALIQNLGVAARVRLPRLLPITNLNHHTYNLPLELNFALFPENWILFDATAAVVLYSHELQKAIPVLTAFFINRFSVTAEYYGYVNSWKIASWNIVNTADNFNKLKDGKLHYRDYISLGFNMTLTPNFGMFSKLARAHLNANLLVYINKPNNKERVSFKVNFKFDL